TGPSPGHGCCRSWPATIPIIDITEHESDMSIDFKQVKEIFLAAVDQADPKERQAFLRQACGDDAALRRKVEALLGRHEQTNNFLEQAAFEAATFVAPSG